jgi:hypothetical protein
MDTEKRIIIGQPINGISINRLEYLLGGGEFREYSEIGLLTIVYLVK